MVVADRISVDTEIPIRSVDELTNDLTFLKVRSNPMKLMRISSPMFW
jgi:hypothetical protein